MKWVGAVLLGASCAAAPISGQAAGLQILRGQVPAAARLRPIDRLPATNQLDLTIALPLRNREALSNLLAQIYNPASPNFHHYLSPEQFAEQFGPAERDYQAAITFATSHGLTVTGTHPNRTLLEVRGPVLVVERAFHVNLRRYQHPSESRVFFAPDAEPTLDLAVPMLSISGLDDFILPRPMNLKTTSFRKFSSATTDAVANETNYSTGSGPRGTFIGKDFRLAYAPGVTLTGAGQTVGLFELDGYFPSDITAYESLAGLPNVPLTNVYVDGVTGAAGGQNMEVALDIDMAIAMAPGLSRVIVYEGRATTPNNLLNRMATDNLAKQLSSSWGFGSQVDPAREQIYQQFAAQGQTMFQASGDVGAWSGPIYPPSDDALLTIVGGTSLTTAPGGAWLSETTWQGSGGGVSTSYPIPIWQQSIGMSANHGSTTMRNIPDVACLADAVIWVIVNHGDQGAIGGTSASAPLWAGFAALANQKAAANSQPPIGFLNPTLSAIGQGAGYASAFHDITSGNNITNGNPTNFSAVPGFDLCTGWGTPTGSNLISALVSPPDALLITPAAGIVSSGPVGGPFNPSAQNFSLTTFGPSVNWTLANPAPWLNVSPTNGTVTSNGPPTIVTFSLNSAASNLPAGSYTATVSFTNLNDSFVQNRQFTMAVVTAPMITSQPSNQTALPGASATFTVGTASNALLFYQWQKNTTNLSDGGNVIGSTTGALTLSQVSQADAATYAVIVSNAAGSILSSNATLTITSVTAPAITLTTLYQFTGGADGGNPNGLTQLANSNFFGTTQNGGVLSSGSVFVLPAAGTPSVIYSFTGGNDGGHPQDALAQGADGNLYGTTFDGGGTDNGTIFKITTNGFLTGLVSLDGPNGDLPYSGLTPGTDGNFYGTTYQGGTSGRGTVYKMTPGGSLTTLYSFTGGNDGGSVSGGLTLGPDGSFYGTTFKGGTLNKGTLFKISTNGILTTLLSFNGTNGSYPYAGVTLDENGNFYGVTSSGGSTTNGIIFRWSATGVFTNLYSFTGGNDGAQPTGGLAQGRDGNFYGTTAWGGAYGYGTVFRMTATGALTNLVQFDGFNGANPSSTLTPGLDGNIYGTTQTGGAGGAGVIFRLNDSGALQFVTQPASQTVYSGANVVFSVATVGGVPSSYQWLINGTNLSDGGNVSGSSTRVLTISNVSPANVAVYSVVVSNSFGPITSSNAVLGVIVSPPFFTLQPVSQSPAPGATVTFTVAVSGSLPLTYQWKENGVPLTDGGGLSGSTTSTLTLANVLESNSGTYSVVASNPITSLSSSNALLTVIPGSAAGTRLATLHAFTGGNDGSSPSGLTLATDSNLYGTTQFGGAQHHGSVFRVSPGGIVSNIASFGVEGFGPANGVVQGLDGNFYGTTQFGGTNSTGNVFRMTPTGVLSNLYSFTGGVDGNSPVAGLIRGADGNFYGTTKSGGNFGDGTIFKITPAGVISNLYSFTGNTDGSSPTNALVQDAAGNFYGVTPFGGSHGFGNVFQLTANGAFTTIYSFTGGSDGKYPNGPLALGSDGNLYGTTKHNLFHGFEFYGTVFKLTPRGAYTLLYMQNTPDGHYSSAGMIQGGDGNFYGTMEFGGTINNNGTAFYITPGGVPTTLVNFDGFDEGSQPETPLTQGADGNFYGTTSANGPGGHGTVFRIGFTTAPQITASPASQNAFVGATVSMIVAATGSPLLGYQWQLNGTNLSNVGNISGATARILTLANLALTNAGTYTVIVSNALGSASNSNTPAVLSVSSAAPAITSSPSPQTVLPGSTVMFDVGASGNPPLFYQWRKNATNLTDSVNLAGSTNTTLTIYNVSAADAGTYSAVVSNALGSSAPSSGALLTVINVTAPGTMLASLYSFVGGKDGAIPNGLAQDTNGVLLGTSQKGGANGAGAVFQVTSSLTPSNTYTFTGGADGANPKAALARGSDGYFYGSTYNGGTSGSGTLFRLANGAFSNLYSFGAGADGAFPAADLIQGSDGSLYGSASGGGTNNFGTLFKVTPGGAFTGLYSFSGGNDGGQPQAPLVRGADGNFYGTTSAGGSNGYGTVFRLVSNGPPVTIHTFAGVSDGAFPNGLVLGLDGNFYGTTSGGGLKTNGTVFAMNPSGALTKLYDFGGLTNSTNRDGANPLSGLARGTDGNFYGTAANGGLYGDGTLFKITSSGTLTTLGWFDGPNGAHPAAALLQALDGNFYGTTAAGGVNGVGAIFRLGVSLQPMIQAATRTNGTLAFTWSAVTGRTYQLQYNLNPATTNWNNLGGAVTATNGTVSASDTIGPDPQRYYRIVLLP